MWGGRRRDRAATCRHRHRAAAGTAQRSEGVTVECMATERAGDCGAISAPTSPRSALPHERKQSSSSHLLLAGQELHVSRLLTNMSYMNLKYIESLPIQFYPQGSFEALSPSRINHVCCACNGPKIQDPRSQPMNCVRRDSIVPSGV